MCYVIHFAVAPVASSLRSPSTTMSGLFDELPMTSAGIETERVDGGTTATPSSVPSSPETPTDSSLPSPTLSQHPEFWFTDGSIILVAQDMMFRVHKSFLSRHSVIFRDMFSLPQPSLSSLNSSRPISQDVDVRRLEDTEGCSAVWLHDSAEDVSSLLYALYDGPYVDILRSNACPLFQNGASSGGDLLTRTL